MQYARSKHSRLNRITQPDIKVKKTWGLLDSIVGAALAYRTDKANLPEVLGRRADDSTGNPTLTGSRAAGWRVAKWIVAVATPAAS